METSEVLLEGKRGVLMDMRTVSFDAPGTSMALIFFFFVKEFFNRKGRRNGKKTRQEMAMGSEYKFDMSGVACSSGKKKKKKN